MAGDLYLLALTDDDLRWTIFDAAQAEDWIEWGNAREVLRTRLAIRGEPKLEKDDDLGVIPPPVMHPGPLECRRCGSTAPCAAPRPCPRPQAGAASC